MVELNQLRLILEVTSFFGGVFADRFAFEIVYVHEFRERLLVMLLLLLLQLIDVVLQLRFVEDRAELFEDLFFVELEGDFFRAGLNFR